MKPLAAIVIAALLASCASHGVMVSQEQVAALERGRTTEADVISRLGQPTTITTYNGRRTLVYSGAQSQARPASFIPIVGPLVAGADVRASSVILTFGADGRLADVISSQHASGSAAGFAADKTPSVDNTPRVVQ